MTLQYLLPEQMIQPKLQFAPVRSHFSSAALMIQGTTSVESRFGFDYIRCIGAGLLIAILSGCASMLFGVPFLTSGHLDLHIPLIGEVPLASAIGFDTGVYLVVFGGAMLILSLSGLALVARFGPTSSAIGGVTLALLWWLFLDIPLTQALAGC